MVVLISCPKYQECFEHYCEVSQRSTTSAFDCSDCTSYKCYRLGFQDGVTQLRTSVIKALDISEGY